MEIECAVWDFNHGMVVGTSWAGLGVSETADMRDFHTQQLIQNGVKNKEHQ